MAVLPHDDFHTLAVACVRAFTPKHPDNAHKAIEFDLDIDGEPFTLRAWAPSNYRQVWGRLPERLREKRPGRRSFGEWVLLADHDSGWTSAFNVFDCARPPEYGVELARVRTGDLPVAADGGFVRVDEQSGQHLAPLSGRMWNVDFQKEGTHFF